MKKQLLYTWHEHELKRKLKQYSSNGNLQTQSINVSLYLFQACCLIAKLNRLEETLPTVQWEKLVSNLILDAKKPTKEFIDSHRQLKLTGLFIILTASYPRVELSHISINLAQPFSSLQALVSAFAASGKYTTDIDKGLIDYQQFNPQSKLNYITQHFFITTESNTLTVNQEKQLLKNSIDHLTLCIRHFNPEMSSTEETSTLYTLIIKLVFANTVYRHIKNNSTNVREIQAPSPSP
jgi:hypothetical protein